MIVCDRQMRVYIVLSDNGDAVRFIERGSNGPDEIRRAQGESGDSVVAIRSMPSQRFHEIFFSLAGYTRKSTGDVAKSFLYGAYTMDARTRYALQHIIYLEDMIEFIREQKANRRPGVALERARMTRARADREHVERQERIAAKQAKKEKKLKKRRNK